jgi:hypothetical protein
MPSDQNMPASSEPVPGVTDRQSPTIVHSGKKFRLAIIPSGGFSLPGGDGSLAKSFKRSAGWAHTSAALIAFSSDVVKPVAPHCTVWVPIGALVLLTVLVVAMKLRQVSSDLLSTIVVFCITTAVLSVIVIGLQRYAGGQDGAFAELVPGIKQMQQELGLIQTQIGQVQADTRQIRETQEAERKRAEERQNELKRLVMDAAGGGAPAVQAIA